MKLVLDQEAIQYVKHFADIALKAYGLQELQNVNYILSSIETYKEEKKNFRVKKLNETEKKPSEK